MKTQTIAMTAALIASAQLAMAEDMTFGALEYTNSCAQCHGADGKGGGPMAGYLTTALPDLTVLQKNNGGVFPLTDLYAVIEGRGEMGPHGTREMPAWGTRYEINAEDQLGMEFSVDRETFVRTRILALIEHLASLQEM